MEIQNLDLTALEEQKNLIEKQIKKAKRATKSQDLKLVRSLIQKHGFKYKQLAKYLSE